MRNIRENLSGNEVRVLKRVYDFGPISRASLARQLQLSRASITLVAKRLIALNLLIEVGKGDTTERGGRKEVLLMVNPQSGYVLSIQIERDFSKVGLLYLNSNIIFSETLFYSNGSSPQHVFESIFQFVQNAFAEYRIDQEKILGIGVGLPGIIDYQSGMLREAETNSWQGFPIKETLQQMFELPVFIENDVKTLTLGEYQFGAGRHDRDLVCIWVGNGIGAGIIVDGHLLRGVTSSAGEIGYNELYFDISGMRSLLTSGISPKDWGEILSLSSIKRAIRQGLQDGWKSTLLPTASIADFLRAAEENDPLAVHIAKLYGNLLGKVCTNLIYCFNPPLLVLHGALFYNTSLIANEVRRHVAHGILRSPVEAVEIQASKLAENAVLVGAAALVFDYYFHFWEKLPIGSQIDERSRDARKKLINSLN